MGPTFSAPEGEAADGATAFSPYHVVRSRRLPKRRRARSPRHRPPRLLHHPASGGRLDPARSYPPGEAHRQDELQRDQEVPDHGHDREEQRHNDQDDVPAEPGGEPFRGFREFRIDAVGMGQPRTDRIAPEDRQQRGGQKRRDSLDGRRNAPGLRGPAVLRQKPGRDRQKRHHEQQEEIETGGYGVGPLEYSVIALWPSHSAPTVAQLTK
jgi:hypothetical protein